MPSPRLRPLPRILCALTVCAVVLGVAPPAPAQPAPDRLVPAERLDAVIADTLDTDTFAGAFWGLHVVNLESGEVLHARNETKSFVPGSNVKLFTAAAALERLGPTYRYHTPVYVDGPVEDGVLRGNVIVDGVGDPTLGGYPDREDPTRIFRQWADSLRQRGITRIEGAVIGAAHHFNGAPFGKGWSWADLTHGYGAAVSGLVFNENKVDLEVQGASRVGEPAHVRLTPLDTEFVRIVNQSQTIAPGAEDDEEYERTLGTNTVHVRTRVPPGAIEDASIAVHDPAQYFVHTLRNVLLDAGISVQGDATALEGPLPVPAAGADSVQRVASYTSPPLVDILQTLNRESRNLYAEQLLRTLSLESPPDLEEDLSRGSAALGLAAVERTAVRAGVDTSRLQLVDGSGLSRQNLISPQALTQLLRHMWHHEDRALRDAFLESLPRGSQNGTIEYRFRGRNGAGPRVRAKTGTLSNVSSLSGYVRTRAGVPLAFSLVANHHHAEDDQVRAAQDVIVNTLAQLPL